MTMVEIAKRNNVSERTIYSGSSSCSGYEVSLTYKRIEILLYLWYNIRKHGNSKMCEEILCHEYIWKNLWQINELHMSQIELSRRTGIATSTISDWRKKKINPQVDKLVAICKALDMSLVDLLCNGDEKEEK